MSVRINNENCPPELSISSSRPNSIGSTSTSSDDSIRSVRAAKVFGKLIGDDETSLSYSPSPFARKQTLGNITNICNSSPMRTLPFGAIKFTPQKVMKKDMAEKEDKKEKHVDEYQKSASHSKGNKEENGAADFLHSPLKRLSVASETKKTKHIPKRKAMLAKYRTTSLSNIGKLSTTQNAIDLATESINQTLNASRLAKVEHTRQVSEEVARLKEEWIAEKEEAKHFYKETAKTKRELLDLRKELTSQYAKAKVEDERAELQKRLYEIEKEIQFKSDTFVQHKNKLKENEDRDRRISVAVRTRIRKEKVAAEDSMRLERIEERHEHLELQWAASRDANNYKKECEQERRDSFALRNSEGNRQRREEQERRLEEDKIAHERFELKMAGERDVDKYKKRCAKERRESFAFRNAEGKHQRQKESERLDEEKNAAHKRFEFKMSGEHDADKYRAQCEKERRESFALRNAEGRRQRQEEEDRIQKEKNDAQNYFELKMAAKRDVDKYVRRCEKARRESFALRGQESVRHHQVMEEIKMLAKEKEHEAYLLNWAAQDDVKEYLTAESEKRRKSFAFRNQEGKRHRELEDQWRCEELQKAHEVEKVKAACQKDVEAYKKKCAERDRASFCYRGKELHLQRLEAEKEHEKECALKQERSALESEARGDVEEYLKDCKRRRRLSLAFRAKERRQHSQWKKKEAIEDRTRRSRHVRNMALDQRYVEYAREKERAMMALNELKHAACSFKMNPFASLLN